MLRPIDKQVQTTYHALRLTAAAIAIAFPLLLWVGGKMACFSLRYCMSDYYWAAPGQHCPCNEVGDVCQKKEIKLVDPDQRRLSEMSVRPGTMRNWFVGLLFATGAVLFVNRGYTKEEDWALSIAGVLAWGIALFPEHWSCYKDGLTMHGICALAFFGAIAYVAIFCSRNTLDQITDRSKKKRIDRAYKGLSTAMIASPLTALAFNFIGNQHSYMYWAEFLGIYAFAGYWLVKTYEINIIQKQREKRKLEMSLSNNLDESSLMPPVY